MININPIFDTFMIVLLSVDDPSIPSPDYSTKLLNEHINLGSFCLCHEDVFESGCELGEFLPLENAMIRSEKREFVFAGERYRMALPFEGSFCLGLNSEEATSDDDFRLFIQRDFEIPVSSTNVRYEVLQLQVLTQLIGLLTFWWTGVGGRSRPLFLVMLTTSFFSSVIETLFEGIDETQDRSSRWNQMLLLICLLKPFVTETCYAFCTYGILTGKSRMSILISSPRTVKRLLSLYLFVWALKCVLLFVEGHKTMEAVNEVVNGTVRIFLSIALSRCLPRPPSNSNGDLDPRLNRTRIVLCMTELLLFLCQLIVCPLLFFLDVFFLSKDLHQGVPLKNVIMPKVESSRRFTGIEKYTSNLAYFEPTVVLVLLLWIWSKAPPSPRDSAINLTDNKADD